MKKCFYLGWLILGFVQTVAFTACGSPQNVSEGLLSNANTDTQQRSPSNEAALPFSRVSLGFFDKPTQASLEIRGGFTLASDSTWAVGPAEGTISSGAVGDYRSHPGCLSFSNYNGVQLCFQVQGDVSNLALNSSDMEISGLPQFISTHAQPADCTGNVGAAVLMSAGSDGKKFQVLYSLPCDTGSVTARLTVSQI